MATTAFKYPAYQIDFSAVAAGKRVAATKRRIRWRFGYPNLAALQAGKTGIECRGEEHDVTIVWSVTSGKRQIMMDGREIHYSSTRTGVLDHSWSTKGNHVMKVVCHAAAPVSGSPGFRQYDLFIDGQSFFTMPKLYELGIKSPSRDRDAGMYAAGGYGGGGEYARSNGRGAVSGGGYDMPRSEMEEEEQLQRAIDQSLEESRRHLGGGAEQKPPPAPVPAPAPTQADLLEFSAEPTDSFSAPSIPPAQPPSYGVSMAYSGDASTYGSASTSYLSLPAPPTMDYSVPPGLPPIPPTPQQGYPQPMYPTQAPTTMPGYPPAQPMPPQPYPSAAPMYQPPPMAETTSFIPEDDPFAPKPPSHTAIASEIMSAYGGGSVGAGFSTPASYDHHSAPPTYAPWGSPQPPATPAGSHLPQLENGGASPATPLMSMSTLAKTEEEPANEFEAALKKLVNVDRIDEPAEQQVKLAKQKEEKLKEAHLKGKSKPIPPAARDKVAPGATLDQIKTVKPEHEIKEGIMNPAPQLFRPGVAMAGAMVIYGQPPPTMQQPVGYGQAPPGVYYPPQPGYPMMPPQPAAYGGPPPPMHAGYPPAGYYR